MVVFIPVPNPRRLEGGNMHRKYARPVRRHTLTWLFSAAMLMAFPAASAEKERFRLEHLLRIDRVTEAHIAPNGSRVAVVTERFTPEKFHSTRQTVWLVPRDGGPPERVVSQEADASLSHPAWSPDSKRLLYRVSRGELSELVVLDLATGRSTTLQTCADGETIGTTAWAPDSQRIAVICTGPRIQDAAAATERERERGKLHGTVEVARADGTTQKDGLDGKVIIATRSHHYDDSITTQWSPGRRAVVVDVGSEQQMELFRDPNLLDVPDTLQWEDADTLWLTGTPANPFGGMPFVNGRVLHRYRLAARLHDTLQDQLATDRMPILTGADAAFLVPIDGTIASPWPRQFLETWKFLPLRFAALKAGKHAETPIAEMEVYVGTDARFRWMGALDEPLQGSLYFTWLDRGSNRIRAWLPALAGVPEWRDLTPAATNVVDFSLSADGYTMALVQGDANTPNDVYLLDLRNASAAPRRLTNFGEETLRLYAVSHVEPVRWRSADDRFDIEGWLLKPADYQSGKRYPLILDVHGGPGVAFRNSFDNLHFEGAHQVAPELFASRGYLVLMVNPRGDPGYGREQQEALLEGWEYPTRHDLIEGVNEMVRRGIADPDRLGIAGASYGGWVAAFAITQTDIFKAASANDPVINNNIAAAAAYRGNLLSNYWMHAGFAGAHLQEKPFPTVDPRKVSAPILLRFGMKEEPPMPSQFYVSGMGYFTYLHAHCMPVEMILHPDEGHGIFDGDTWRDYVERDLAWFDYWLLGKGELPYKPHDCHP